MRLDGAVVVVTGAGSGLGLATAQRLLAAGARVLALDLQAPVWVEGAGAGALAVAADITQEAPVEAALDLAQQRLGGLQALVNCAGIGVAMSTVGWKGPASLEDFRRVIEVNLVGTFNCIRLAAARMAKNPPGPEGERGVVVNTASIAAFEGQAGQAAYAASKAGLVGLTLPVARDLAELGIRVVTLAPGLFDTPMMEGLPAPVRANLGKQPLFPRRLGRPEEFAALVEHVLQNPMLNGETIRLDAGLRLPPR